MHHAVKIKKEKRLSDDEQITPDALPERRLEAPSNASTPRATPRPRERRLAKPYEANIVELTMPFKGLVKAFKDLLKAFRRPVKGLLKAL